MDRQRKTQDRPFSFRPPKTLRDEFERRVAESGLSVNAYLNACVFGRGRKQAAKRLDAARLLGALANLADELRRAKDTPSHGPTLDRTLVVLTEIRTLLMSVLGRKS